MTTTTERVSTRTPSMHQTQVLYGVLELDDTTTPAIHAWREEMSEKAGKAAPSPRDTYMLLAKCHDYGWIDRVEIERAADAPKLSNAEANHGAMYAWHAIEATREAFGRGQAALDNTNQKEEQMAPTATPDAPPTAAPWDGQGEPGVDPTPTPDVDPQHDDDLKELDGDDGTSEDGGDPEVEEPPVKENRPGDANQLSMKVAGGRLRPTQSTLKVSARQREFGTEREFKIGDRIPFTGVLEVRKVHFEQKANGRIVRTQVAIIAECDVLDETDD